MINPRITLTLTLIFIYLLAISQLSFFIYLTTIVYFMYGIVIFFKTKKEQKSALYYVRLNHKKITQRTIILSSINLIVIPLVYFVSEPLIQLKLPYLQLILVIFLLSLWFSSYYENYIISIRAFDEGIKLPGWSSKMIVWDQITDFNIDFLRVSINNEVFEINVKDQEDIQAIFEEWKLYQN